MIPGYNHNVKYKERIFHVQTEDSGKKNPHIITLLYYGGNILDSVKSGYGDKLSLPDIDAQLPNIMQKQHKDVLRGLVTGRYDVRIEERGANASFLNGPAPLNVAEGSQHQTSFGMSTGAPRPKPAAPPPDAVAPAAVAPAGVTPVAVAPLAVKPLETPPPPVAAVPAPAEKPMDKVSDGRFSTEGSFLDAFAKASQTLDAEQLIKALDEGDDKFVFGASNDDKGLGDMMLDFLKGG